LDRGIAFRCSIIEISDCSFIRISIAWSRPVILSDTDDESTREKLIPRPWIALSFGILSGDCSALYDFPSSNVMKHFMSLI
ncbi:MAG TPA: hypothetical protein VE866_02385, partial [Candidatus Binatia bacterium]|nr:hypothetical protein [Candidatus Binatia bacterium]